VRPLDADAKRRLVEDMINGGLERLDPHSTFINTKEYKRFALNSKGTFGGIGIQISTDRFRYRPLVVVSPMVGTPALRVRRCLRATSFSRSTASPPKTCVSVRRLT